MADTTIQNIGPDGPDYSTSPPPPYPGDYNPPQAAKGTNASDDGKKCGTGAGDGSPGHQGYTGNAGTGGGKGGPAGQIKFTVDIMQGNYVFATIGGKGGGGQIGGPGGKGQIGGAGGDGSSHCGSGKQGPGGQGGQGGPGGQGGDGGDAGEIYITYNTAKSIPPPTISAKVTPGAGGKSNNGGDGGGGGQGNPDGGKGPGGAMPTNPGKGGANGQIYVNGQPQS